MKYIAFLIILFVSCQTIYAQKKVDDLMADSTKLYIEYNDYNGYINDSIYTKMGKQSVFLGEKATIYINKTRTSEEFLTELREKANPRFITPEEEVESFKRNYDVEKVVSTVWIRYYGAPDYLIIRKYNEGDVWSSDTLNYEWTPMDEFKTINGYKCQKATAKNKRGENITVWFTEDIPISSGPYFLTGLPGLILEYYNSAGKRLIRATTITSTNIPKEYFRKWLKGPIVTKEEDWEIYEGASEKARQFLRMLKNNKDSN